MCITRRCTKSARMLRLVSWVLLVVVEVTCTMVKTGPAEETFKQCLTSGPEGTLGYCLGVGAISKLRSLDADPEFDVVDGFTLLRDEQQLREDYNFVETDPSDFRSIVETMGHVISKRRIRWDLGSVYPGLEMHLSPSSSPTGVLEFSLDSRREALNQYSLKEASTGYLLARQFLVPMLLGFKFNLISLVPIIFGVLAIIAKKAAVLSKIALVITSALGLGSLMLGGYGGNRVPYHVGGGYQHHQHHLSGLSQYYSRFPNEEYYRDDSKGKIAYPVSDQINIHGSVPQVGIDNRQESSSRNFAWSDSKEDT